MINKCFPFLICIIVLLFCPPGLGRGDGIECNVKPSICGARCCDRYVCVKGVCQDKPCSKRGGTCSNSVICCDLFDTCYNSVCHKRCTTDKPIGSLGCSKDKPADSPCCEGLVCMKGKKYGQSITYCAKEKACANTYNSCKAKKCCDSTDVCQNGICTETCSKKYEQCDPKTKPCCGGKKCVMGKKGGSNWCNPDAAAEDSPSLSLCSPTGQRCSESEDCCNPRDECRNSVCKKKCKCTCPPNDDYTPWWLYNY